MQSIQALLLRQGALQAEIADIDAIRSQAWSCDTPTHEWDALCRVLESRLAVVERQLYQAGYDPNED